MPAEATAPKIGRPSLRTPELERRLMLWTSEGGTLRAFCRLPGSPSHETVYNWLDQDAELQTRFDKARLLGGRQLAEEILEIADNPQVGEIRTEESIEVEVGGKGGEKVPATKVTVRTEDMLGHRKLQIDARERLLKLWFPEWFAKKVDVAHAGKVSFEQLVRAAVEDEGDGKSGSG